jgi:Fe2+ or Zn2+ uptake regulation protein
MNNPMLNRFRDRLRRARVGRTEQRDHIFLMLYKMGPCTRKELADALDGRVDRATVYRTLHLFLDLGIAMEVRYRFIELSAPFKQHHHHLTCAQCGWEFGFNSTPLEVALRGIAEGHDFVFDGYTHQVEITGLCPYCRDGLKRSSL